MTKSNRAFIFTGCRILTAMMFLVGVVSLTGCSTIRLGDLSLMSTKNVNLDEVDLDTLPQQKGIEGEDTKFVLLFIPFGIPHLEDAVDDALEKGGGDLIADAVIYSKGWWFIIGETTLSVKGTVINTKGK